MKTLSKSWLLNLAAKPLTNNPKKANCKFKQSCNLYSEESYTCTHKGGDYCGRYRTLRHGRSAPQVETEIGVDVIEPIAPAA